MTSSVDDFGVVEGISVVLVVFVGVVVVEFDEAVAFVALIVADVGSFAIACCTLS
jgi:hypothetical protein